jgi:hypothetical protein
VFRELTLKNLLDYGKIMIIAKVSCSEPTIFIENKNICPPLTISHGAFYIFVYFILLMRAGSENDSPRMFKEDQLYIIIVLAFGGCDLEAHFFRTADQSHSVFIQVLPCYIL